MITNKKKKLTNQIKQVLWVILFLNLYFQLQIIQLMITKIQNYTSMTKNKFSNH
jgi:hypothetical protein